ncbi:hypothetical protein ACFL1H_06880 [Nanoarchaeota archaeon]
MFGLEERLKEKRKKNLGRINNKKGHDYEKYITNKFNRAISINRYFELNKKYYDKSGTATAEFDIEFKRGYFFPKTWIVECKDTVGTYDEMVKFKNKIKKYYKKDYGRGIFVTSQRFEKKALQLADKYGIQTRIIKKPNVFMLYAARIVTASIVALAAYNYQTEIIDYSKVNLPKAQNYVVETAKTTWASIDNIFTKKTYAADKFNLEEKARILKGLNNI